MKDILLCSSDTLLVRNLYGILRDLGFRVDTVEHTSHAVHKALERRYDFAIVDAEPFGLPADDAEEVLRAVAPRMSIIALGARSNERTLRELDLEEFTKSLHAFAGSRS
jgi:DNA-binding response OmpR family regulator